MGRACRDQWHPVKGTPLSRLAFRANPAVLVELHAEHGRPLAERRGRVVAEERAPPPAVPVLEEHVVAAVRDGQVAVAVRTQEVVGSGDHAIVVLSVELGAREVVAAGGLENERPLKAHVAGVGGFQEAGRLGQARHVVLHAGDLAVLVNEVNRAVIVLEEGGVDLGGERAVGLDVGVRPFGLAGGAAEDSRAAVVDAVRQPERALDEVDFGCPDGAVAAAELFLPGAVPLDGPDESEQLPRLQVRRLPDADALVGFPPRGVARRAGQIVVAVAADTDNWGTSRTCAATMPTSTYGPPVVWRQWTAMRLRPGRSAAAASGARAKRA